MRPSCHAVSGADSSIPDSNPRGGTGTAAADNGSGTPDRRTNTLADSLSHRTLKAIEEETR
jgi:hypothetical protein